MFANTCNRGALAVGCCGGSLVKGPQQSPVMSISIGEAQSS